jgi:hypothetical protein
MRSRQFHILVVFAILALALVAPAVRAQVVVAGGPQGEQSAQQAPKPSSVAPASAVPTRQAGELLNQLKSTATPAPASAPLPKDWNANVRVEVTIADVTRGSASTQKSISVTVRNEGRGSVRSGVSFPVPSTTFTPVAQGGAAFSPLTSWQYKDMGLSLDVTSAQITDNFVKLRLAVEYNPVDEKTANAEGGNALPAGQNMASFAQFRQNLDIVLESGKPIVVATSSDPVPSRERKATLEVKATILR